MENYKLFAEDGKHKLSITEKTESVPRKHLGNIYKILDEELAPVAFDNNYDSLYNRPSIPSFTSSQLNYLKNKLPAAITFDSYGNPALANGKHLIFNLKEYNSEIGFSLGSKQTAISSYIKNGKPVFAFYKNSTDSNQSVYSFLDMFYDDSTGVGFGLKENDIMLQSRYKIADNTVMTAGALSITKSDDEYEKIFTFLCRPKYEGNEKVVKFVSGNVECESVILKSSTPGSTKKFKITVDDTGTLNGNAATATKLATARTISLTGSVTGSGTFDGSGNLSISTTTNHTHNYAGSASAGGSANSAVKLDTATAGDSNTPVYFSGGKPVACTSLDLNTSGNAATASKVNNKLTVGSKTYDGSAAVTIAASDLGLASAMLFLGTTTTAITDGATTNPVVLGGSNKTVTAGNVVLYGSKEFVWTGNAWEELGNEGSYKIVQAAVADPSASGTSNTFIDTISQDTNGKITATKKTVAVTNSAPTLAWGTTSTIGTVAGTNLQVKMPANPNTDTKVTQTVTTSNAAYPLLLAPNGQTTTTTTTSYFDSGVTLNPSTNTIAANVSGNAATATKLSKSEFTTDTIDNVTHSGLLYGTVGSYTGPGFSSSDAMILSMSWNSSNNYGAQIALDDTTTPNMYVRNKGSGSWSSWSKVLLSTNYTDYTVKKDGTGASGTWSISVTGSSASCTGNAATATKLATARTIRTNLASTYAVAFDGSASITTGVTGTLPIANGGTGATTASAARDNLGAQSKVLYGSSAPSDSTGSNGDMYIALESGDFKKDIVDLIYPVGSIYISMNSANPSTLFGGTWEAFGQGRVLIGAGTGNDGSIDLSFAAGGTGGEYKHTLRTSEIPSHEHDFSGTTAANNRSHTHTYTKATGVQGHTLTIAEMPSHSHTMSRKPAGSAWNMQGTQWTNQFGGVDNSGNIDTTANVNSTGGGGSHSHGLSTSSTNSDSESRNHTHTFNGTTRSTGSERPHNNIQPYIVVYMWKRTA